MKRTISQETVSHRYVLEAEDGAKTRVTCTMEKENACHVVVAFLEFYNADSLPHPVAKIRPVLRRETK